MTFESMIDTPAANEVPVTSPPPATSLDQALNVEDSVEETVVVKVQYGNDLRRTACVAKCAPMHDVCAKLFGLSADATVLKYQDEEGDKITMSSNEELNEARALAKDKVLRVFIENKQAPAPPAQEQQQQPHGGAPLYPGLNYDMWSYHHPGGRGMRGGFGRGGFGGFGGRGGFGGFGPFAGRGGFGHHGFHHAPPHHAHPHPPHHMGGEHPHPHPPHMGGHHGHHQHPHQPPSPVQTATFEQNQEGMTATFSHARVSNHGVFSPAHEDAPHPTHCRSARDGASPYWKERKQAFRQHVKFMKETCATEEDREAFKQLKRDMYKEFKHEKKAFKEAKGDEKDKEKREKREKKEEKKEKKERKRCEKRCGDKKDKKDKKEKLIARHVADVTIPDNTELPPDTPVTKTWRLKNSGYVAWPADSQLLFISRRGDDLNGPERVFVGTVEPEQEVEVSVTFVTPTDPGRYIGYYRMATAEGKFGQRVWVSFIIPSVSAPMTDATDKSPFLEQENNKEAEANSKEGEQQPSAPLLDVNME